jgi:hypothetical protein
MNSRILLAFATLTFTLVFADIGSAEQRGSPPTADSRDLLLAALGTATIECLGTVGPDSFDASSGHLSRTFTSCPADPDALARIDALLGVQHSVEGQTDDLSGHYRRTWTRFVRSFPHDRIRSCPTWMLLNVIDAPTRESVARLTRLNLPGKENRRYTVSSPECRSRACAVDRAVACAGGFGQGFIVDTNDRRGTIEVDPAWWLLDLGPPQEDPCDDYFDDYKHGFCAGLQESVGGEGSIYGSLERAGDRCCVQRGDFVDTNGIFEPIDCGGGWYCMTYCTSQLPTSNP